jgi:hypothetical protein
MKRPLLLLLAIVGVAGHLVGAEHPRHATYMELPSEYRAWFRNPDGSCMPADSPVWTTQGPVAIADLNPERDAIWFLAADGKIRATYLYRVFPTKQVTSLTVLHLVDDRKLRLTPDHRVAVGSVVPPAVQYVPAAELQPGTHLATWSDSGFVMLRSVDTERLAQPTEVWDIQNLDACWESEGNFFAGGILVHNCVQCSNGMVGMHINRPEWTFLLWDTEYGSAVRGGSWPAAWPITPVAAA